MRIPQISGLIRRRLLVNFRVDPEVIQRLLPAPFRPKLHSGHAIAGMCLIRLEQIRPKALPAVLGIVSENAAHRIAVTWDDEGGSHEGVYIPRRDTDSFLNRVAGGRVFPGKHHRAAFYVRENGERISLRMQSADGLISVAVTGRVGRKLPERSVFGSLEEASKFFQAGSLGYSATAELNRLDGVRLQTSHWRVEPLDVEDVESTYFADKATFPIGSVIFDCALIMRNVAHQWEAAEDLYVRVAG